MDYTLELMLDLIKELNSASSLYYNTGESFLSDVEFDNKLALLQKWERETGVIYTHSPTQKVGADILEGIPKVELGRPMLSLAKVHSEEEVKTFAGKHDIIGSYKLDGLSVRIWYEDNKLARAATRGNGTVGSDITNHIKYFMNVPLTIPYSGKYIIDGEAIITQTDFNKINQDGAYKNPRNLAAGSLNLLDMNEVQRRQLRFVAWDVVEGDSSSLYKTRIQNAQLFGFDTILPYSSNTSNETIMNAAEHRGYPCDGVVWRFNDIAYGESLGSTAHHYNSGIAWKPKDESAWTRLLNIEYTMGRTGVLTPVAIFEPVELEGTEVERASLHNLSIMEEVLGVHPYFQQEIEVVKANLIIPQIKSSIKSTGRRKEELRITIPIPTTCPICGSPLQRITEVDSTVLWCPAADCPGKLLNKLDHFCSKKGMDIKGLSKATLEKLIDLGWVNEFVDLYNLKDHRAEWIQQPGFGVKSVDKILEIIENSRMADYSKFLPAIGIPMIGNSITKDIIKHPKLSNYEDFRAAVDAHWDFTQIDGIGYEKANSILTFDYSEADRVYRQFITITSIAESTSVPAANLLEGQVIVITGALEYFKNRAELTAFINERGGKVTGSVSKNTTILINNDLESTSSKNRDAKRLGIPILTEEKFLKEYLTL